MSTSTTFSIHEKKESYPDRESCQRKVQPDGVYGYHEVICQLKDPYQPEWSVRTVTAVHVSKKGKEAYFPKLLNSVSKKNRGG